MRAVPAWCGRTHDDPIPPRVRARVFQRHEGKCAACDRKLVPGKWACDHIIALANGGEHAEQNLQPLCSDPCHSNKTVLDVKLKAKAERVRKRHIGIKKPRTITTWRRFNGEIVRASRER